MTSRQRQHEHAVYQGPARALVRLKAPDAQPRGHRAVLYLRVSGQSQVNTDYDPEGLSIPAQRTSCERKAEQMGLDIIREYVEPGRSATRMDQRPVFQSMLDDIKNERDVDYVIVYKLSRMNRNRVDDALVLVNLRKFKVTLVSATESIDETPVGQLMHGILASYNEFRSAEDGADIRYKMGEKARKGGTLGRAKLGYLNVRERFEGREVRTVTIDTERAPFVKLGFELYATGEYTIDRLQAVLTDRGLVSRPGRYPAGPVSASKLQAMLRDPYYVGVITYDGELYQGRHEPLISEELFERVQAIFETRATAGERLRQHPHYLKGSVWCGKCHDDGHESRLLFQRAVGNGGEYFYFFCSRKQDRACFTRYAQIDDVEDAVMRHYRTVRFTEQFAAAVRESLHATLDDQQGAAKLLRDQITDHLAKLDRQEDNLLDLASDTSGPKDKVRSRLRRIAAERAKLAEQLERTDDRLEVGAALIDAALELLRDPEEMYRQSGEKYRRILNQAIFERLYVDDNEVTDHVLREPFAELHEAQERLTVGNGSVGRRPRTERSVDQAKADLLVTALSSQGSSKTAMVEVSGLEPPTSTLRTFARRRGDLRIRV
jgi:site-specific DNA recombinase